MVPLAVLGGGLRVVEGPLRRVSAGAGPGFGRASCLIRSSSVDASPSRPLAERGVTSLGVAADGTSANGASDDDGRSAGGSAGAAAAACSRLVRTGARAG